MRLVDIYRQNDDQLEVVTTDCIQTGMPVLTRTPIVKSFTMADGSPCIYPAVRDTVSMTAEFECTKTQAAAIAASVRHGRLVFAGLSWSVNDMQIQPLTGAVGYITGGVQVVEKFAGSGIFSVTVPLQLEVQTDGSILEMPVPVVQLTDLTVCGTPVSLSDCRYANGFVCRKTVFANTDTAAVSYTVQIPDGLPEELATQVYIRRGDAVMAECTGDAGTVQVPLVSGENVLLLQVSHGTNFCKAWQMRFTIYRMG